MNPRDFEQREELLVDLMAEYDEALSGDASTDRIDQTAADLDPLFAAEWTGIKECLELLDRVRRREEGSGFGVQDSEKKSSGVAEQGSSGVEILNGSYSTTPLLHSSSRAQDASTSRRLGRFIVERELGRGGLGIVYLAHDPQLGRKVALKIPRFQALLDDDLRRRFLREAEAAARLGHPNLVPVYEVGEENSICYLASEYCPGPTLAQWLGAQQNRVPPVDAATIVLDLANGVEHAHSRGVVHRDIKPSNVMMNEGVGCRVSGVGGSRAGPSATWTPKLTDFGMARLLEQDGEDRTRSGAVIGTLAYMAPEQVEGETGRIDARTDVYALGAILYELLTGTSPYGGQSDVERLRQLLVSQPIAPRKLRRDVPRDLEAVAQKCLTHDPAERYATAGDLAADLQRFLDGRPTVARPLAVSARLVKWTRRRPAIAALCVVSILASAMILAMNARRLDDKGRALEESNQLRTLANRERQRAVDEEATSGRLLYASRMRRAQEAWRDGNLKSMRELLQHYAEGKPEARLRHFEWCHLNHLANLPHRIFRGHEGEVYAAAYTHDNRMIITGGQDGAVRLWDIESGKALAVLREHSSCVNSLDMSPDGDTFVTASCDKTIKLWSLSQRKVLATLARHTQTVNSCAFIDEGKLLVSLSYGMEGTPGVREVFIWDVSARSIHPAWPPADEQIQGFGAARSGKTLVTFASNQAAVWKRQGHGWNLSHRFQTAEAHSGGILTPDEEFIVIPVYPRHYQILSLRDGAILNNRSDHTGGVVDLAFSPAGNRLATASADSSIRIFEFPSGRPERCFLAHEGRAWDVVWSPAGDAIASVGNDGTLRTWDLQRGSNRLHLKQPAGVSHNEVFADFAFLRDGRHVTASYKNYCLAWDITKGQSISLDQVPEPRLQVSDTLNQNAPFTQNSHELLSQWDSRACYLPPRHVWSQGHPPTITVSCSRISADGSQMVEISRGKLRTWSISPFKLQQEQSIELYRNLEAAVYNISPDGRRVCGRRPNGSLEIVDLYLGMAVPIENTPNQVVAAHFSPNGDRLLVQDNKVREFDAYSGKQIRQYSHEAPIAVCYSADGERVAISSNLGFTAIHDAITGEETLRLDGGAGALLFAADGSSLLTNGAPDGGLYLWPGKKEPLP